MRGVSSSRALPGARDDSVRELEQLLRDQATIGAAFAGGEQPPDLLERVFGSHQPVILARRRVLFMCHCGAARFRSHLAALPRSELEDILEHGPLPLVTTCLFCNTTYRFRTRGHGRPPRTVTLMRPPVPA